jgi:hypothetical protein
MSSEEEMGRLGYFFFGVIIGAASVFVSLKYHVVRAADGHHLVAKLSAEFSGTYVDIRSFGFDDWAQHQTLAAAITKAGKAYLLKQSTVDSFTEKVNDYLDIKIGQPQ